MIENIQSFLITYHQFAPFVFILIMALVVVVPPIPGLPLVMGSSMIFGSFLGGVYSTIGVSLGASIAFGISRKFGRPLVLIFFSNDRVIEFENKLTVKRQLIALFLMRIIPLAPFDIVSYVAGLTPIKFRYFILITLVGAFPGNLLLTYLGKLATQWNVYLSLMLCALVVLIFITWPYISKKITERHVK